MKRIRSWLCKARWVAVALGWWSLCAAPAWAAKKTAEPTAGSSGPDRKAWLLPYAIVLLAVGLGMLVVCRSSRRSDRAKPKAYESIEATKR